MRDNLDGFIITVNRRGEDVEGKIVKSEHTNHYNIYWQNSDKQSFIGSLEDWEIENAIRDKKLF